MFKAPRAAKFALFLALTIFSTPLLPAQNSIDAAALRNKWVKLPGKWDYYKSALLQPYDFYPQMQNSGGQKVDLPFRFEPNENYATFHYRADGLEPSKHYATEIYGAIVSSSRIWCNGRLVATSGFLSKDKRAAKEGDSCEVIDLPADADGIIDIVIHVADFKNEPRGILKPLHITEKSNATKFFHLNYFFNMLLAFFLFAHILYNLSFLVLSFRRHSPLILTGLFALLEGSVLLTGITLTQRMLINLPYISHRRVPVALFCLETVLLVIYESSLFKVPTKKSLAMRVVTALNAVAAFAVPPAVFEKTHIIYSTIAIASALAAVTIPSEFAIRRKASDTGYGLKNHFLREARTLSIFLIITACIIDFLAVPQSQTLIHNYYAFKGSILIFGLTQCVIYAFNRDWTLSRVDKYAQTLTNDNNTLARFVSDQILKVMGAPDITKIIPGECRIIEPIIFRAQVKHYNQFAESLGRKELFEIMLEFHKIISPIILDSGGFIAKRDASGFTAIFQQRNTDAIICAARIQKALKEIRRKLRKSHRTDIGVGIAIHAGKAAIGTMGTSFRLDATTISDDVTLTCAVAGQTSKMNAQILITEEAMPYCRNYIEYMYEGHFFIFEGKQVLVYSAMPIVKLENAYEETLEAIEEDNEEL